MSDQKQEDALDLALSGQSKAGRVIDSAAALIAGQAFEFRLSHAVGGAWPANELEAKAEHDAMLELVGELGRLKRSIPEIPNSSDHIVDATKMVAPMSRIALKKIEQMGGDVCGVLARNEAGALAAVSDMGQVTWLDDYIMAPVARDEDVALPKQAAREQGYAEKENEKEELKGNFPDKEESLIRQGDAEPVAWWDGDTGEPETAFQFEQDRIYTIPLYTHPPKAQAVPEAEMFWDADDAELFGGSTPDEFADHMGVDLSADDSLLVNVQSAVKLPNRRMRIWVGEDDEIQWEWVQPPQEGEGHE